MDVAGSAQESVSDDGEEVLWNPAADEAPELQARVRQHGLSGTERRPVTADSC